MYNSLITIAIFKTSNIISPFLFLRAVPECFDDGVIGTFMMTRNLWKIFKEKFQEIDSSDSFSLFLFIFTLPDSFILS